MTKEEEKARAEDIASMAAKIELSAKIAQIALACPNCNGHARNAITRFQNRNKNKNVDVDPVRGHSSLAATNDSKDGLTSNEINRPEYT